MKKLFAIYGALAVLVLAYLVSLIVRSPDQSLPLVDNWMVAGLELVLAGLCLARAATLRRSRLDRGYLLPLVLSSGLLLWSLGDVVVALESANGGVSSPSLADPFYLGFYPLAYAALVLLLTDEVAEFLPASWLDGAVAGLGAASLCAAFAFPAIVHSLGGEPLAIAINLAYPIGDVLLFGLAAGGTAMLAERRPRWLLVAIACAINAVGDTFNLFNLAGKSSHVSLVFDGIAWPVAILLMSISVWLPSRRTEPKASTSVTPTFLLPALGALVSLSILLVGSMHQVVPIATGLAAATLLVVGLRLALSLRDLRSLNEQRRHQAITDHLTGLGNRRQLEQVLNNFFASYPDSSGGRRLAFLFIDLDHFKEINDSFGHAAGDELLRDLGPRLKGLLRSSDLLVRLGGDELGVLLLDTDPDYAGVVARRLLTSLQEPFLLGSVSVRIGASIGIAVAPKDAQDATGLLRCADLAMYRAKAKRSAIEVYEGDAHDSGNQLLLVNDLRDAVEERSFVLHYQPLVELSSQMICAAEALIRWPHARHGLIPPLRFLPLAEEAGLMPQLTAIVLDHSLRQCAAWQPTRPGLRISVNVSTTNLLDPKFMELVESELKRFQLSPATLMLEITETTILREFNLCSRVVSDLRDLGVAVSIDDFGAGFTSLAYLADLAVSEIKLDRAFTAQLTKAKRSEDLVKATVALGHALGMRVVAEGIEDRATLDILSELGCDLGQGYFLGKPVPASEFPLEARPAADANPGRSIAS